MEHEAADDGANAELHAAGAALWLPRRLRLEASTRVLSVDPCHGRRPKAAGVTVVRLAANVQPTVHDVTPCVHLATAKICSEAVQTSFIGTGCLAWRRSCRFHGS